MANSVATEIKVYRDKKTWNQYNWQGLTTGALVCIAMALANAHKAGDLIAYDCYRNITNCLYDVDKKTYDFIIQRTNLK